MLISRDTPLINTTTNAYPVFAYQIKTSKYSFGEFIDTEILAELGYAPVTPTVRPDTGDFRESTPQLVDGVYYQFYEEHIPNATEIEATLILKKSTQQNQLTELLDKALSDGFAFDFGGVDGVQHVQVRDKDRVNLLGIIKQAELNPTAMHVFRTQENNSLQVSAAQVLEVAVRAGAAYTAVMQHYWLLKDLTSFAASPSEIPAVPASLWENTGF